MPKEQFFITIILSLAIKEALEEILPGEIKIKWPNDIFFNNEKIAGLLIENVLRGNSYDSCIAGIGLNVNQTEFLDDIKATSMKLATHKELELNIILNSLMKSISSFYLKLQTDRKSLKERYHQSMLGLGERRKFKAAGGEFDGIIEGTDEFGRLLIKKGNEVLVFQHKQVQMLFWLREFFFICLTEIFQYVAKIDKCRLLLIWDRFTI